MCKNAENRPLVTDVEIGNISVAFYIVLFLIISSVGDFFYFL